MGTAAFDRLESLAREPAAIERSVEYITRQLKLFAKKQDRILICFPNTPGTLGDILDRAVRQVGAIPIHWGDDRRWVSLIRTAFLNKVTAIIGQPVVVLGLYKLSKVTKTPLFIRHVLIAGYPCFDWILDGVAKGLDCDTWGYFTPGGKGIICGQSCGQSRGVHIREEEYDIEIIDDEGNALPDGQIGEICVVPKRDPTIRVPVYDRGKIDRSGCPCGRPSARLTDLSEGRDTEQDILKLAADLIRWNSVLDVRVARGEYGIELEAIVFPGLELPKFPSCAKMVVRNWDHDRDEPFWLEPSWKNAPN